MNIGNLLASIAKVYPDKLALAHSLKRLTYAQFNACSNRLANALMRLGIRS